MTAVDAPPADLFRHNEVAFHLWAELAAHPRRTLTRTDAAKILRVAPGAAAGAVDELVRRGALVRVGHGTYGEPSVQPAGKSEPRPAKPCLRCGRPIGPRREKFCSDRCGIAWHNAAHTLREQRARADQFTRCVVCGATFPRRRHAKVDLYCSPHCARAAEQQQELARDIAGGTAHGCETCGRQIPARRRWCSRQCQPRSRGGLLAVDNE